MIILLRKNDYETYRNNYYHCSAIMYAKQLTKYQEISIWDALTPTSKQLQRAYEKSERYVYNVMTLNSVWELLFPSHNWFTN